MENENNNNEIKEGRKENETIREEGISETYTDNYRRPTQDLNESPEYIPPPMTANYKRNKEPSNRLPNRDIFGLSIPKPAINSIIPGIRKKECMDSIFSYLGIHELLKAMKLNRSSYHYFANTKNRHALINREFIEEENTKFSVILNQLLADEIKNKGSMINK